MRTELFYVHNKCIKELLHFFLPVPACFCQRFLPVAVTMGAMFSEQRQMEVAVELFQVVQSSSVLPDIRIDDSILKYSGLDSASALDSHSEQLIVGVASRGSVIVKDLGSSLSNFNNVPNAVGLGALVISILLDIMANRVKKNEGGGDVLGMMRRVFAEEKASGVRDCMDEYIKRFRLEMHNPEELLSETKRLEKQLSNALTQLRNSMLHDHQMSSRSMKHWTNGAAFHLQMLIHKARMEMVKGAKGAMASSDLDCHVKSIGQLAEQYEEDLNKLLSKYEMYKRSTIYTSTTGSSCPSGGAYSICVSINCGHFDTEFNSHVGFDNPVDIVECRAIKDIYQNYLFKNWNQLYELRGYFPAVKQKLKVTIMQNSTFSIQKFLPISRIQK